MAGKLVNYVAFPLMLPLILTWLALARVLAAASPFLIFPVLILRRQLYWAAPFVPAIYKQRGWLKGGLMRLGFEGTYTMNVVRRLLTLPLRRSKPDFYLCGFPKCGTTSLANYLKQHPSLSGIDGMPWHDVLSKESHFFNGVLGHGAGAANPALLRSFFPTILTRWWAECVRGVQKWQCFDACPLPACLDFTAARIKALTPDAKLVFMLRDPVSGCFSAEIMFRNLGLNLDWSFMEDLKAADPRFATTPDDERYWAKVAALSPEDPLPEDLMQRFYSSAGSVLRCGKYWDRLQPFLRNFKRENMLFIDFHEFTTNPEAVVQQVLEFVGVPAQELEPQWWSFRELPAGMQGDRRGRRMHPSVKRKLQAYFAEPNLRLYAMLGVDFNWADPEAPRAEGEEEAAESELARTSGSKGSSLYMLPPSKGSAAAAAGLLPPTPQSTQLIAAAQTTP